MLISKPYIYNNFEVKLPASKSISNRVLIINMLAGNKSFPENLADCDDTRAVANWIINQPEVVDIGAAGTAMRFSTALLSVLDGTKIITGSERMKHRPIHVLVDALRMLGAKIDYLESEGFPPLKITGSKNLKGGQVELDGSVSSQFISALMIIAPYMKDGLLLRLRKNIISRPYINMTMSIMKDFGADVEWVSENEIHIKPVHYIVRNYWVENDWSASSYWYEILALSDKLSSLKLMGLCANSLQGDSHVADLFARLGIETRFEMDGGMPVAILSKKSDVVDSLEYDFINQPDLAQTLIVTCCMLNIPFCFSGLSSLKIKETDRISAMITEMNKLGYDLRQYEEGIIEWNGSKRELTNDELLKVAIDTYEDHRMAMAFAPAALKLGTLTINNPHVVSKSYPNFWNDLASLGFIFNK